MESKSPSLKEIIFWDLERELTVTRAVLDRLPEEKYGWKPHEKSMSLGRLAMHVAQLPEWARGALAADELDAATAPRTIDAKDRKDLLAAFDRNVAALREAVKNFDVTKFNATWTMRNGSHVMVSKSRATVYRIWCVNHLIHHRAQLCLCLRLLNIPMPTVYFNTADDPTWVFE